jgi:acyl-CoA-binding protein
MADLQTAFEQAVAASTQLPERPAPFTLLRLYALYKQASVGDASGERPGLTDPVGRAKWDAWNALQGHGREAAMQDYIDLIGSLQ